ncbi:MAG: carboxypeptidase regulatory-like domain-containing protein [Oscillospiraceae bacterium]|nr:carboxypeptidase regulatory-like domain-containing protein [Oscillospiraceae bacterium]
MGIHMESKKKILSLLTAVTVGVSAMLSSVPVFAEQTLIPGSEFDFQPNFETGENPVVWTEDESGIRFGASPHFQYYSTGIRPDNTFGADNYVLSSTYSDESGSRYMNLLFPNNWGIAPGFNLIGTQIVRVEFEWNSYLIGTGGTQDTVFIGPDGVRYFGVTSAYFSENEGGGRIKLTNDTSGEYIKDADGNYLPDNTWYKVSITADFETKKVIKAEFTRIGEDTPAAVLRGFPFIDSYEEDGTTGIGAVRLAGNRGEGNISLDWRVNSFKAYAVKGEYAKLVINVIDDDGNAVSDASVRLKLGEDTGDYITDENGQVITKVAPGEYECYIEKPAYRDPEGYMQATGIAEVTLEGPNEYYVVYSPYTYDPEPDTVTITKSQGALTAPRYEEAFTSKPFEVSVSDQEGVELEDYTVSWAIEPADDPNVFINPDTGEVTVTKGFDGGARHVKKFTVRPTVTIDGVSNDSATETIAISDYLFYEPGRGGSSYGEEGSEPEAHQVGDEGLYISTSTGGEEADGYPGRAYTGIINIPEPIEFEPDTSYELSFDTTVTTKEVYTFGRSAIFTSSDDVDMITLDYIRMGIGKKLDNPDEASGWSSADNSLELTYGEIPDFDTWQHVKILFDTDGEGVTTATIDIGGTVTDLGVMEADDLAKIKLAVARLEQPTDRFAVFKNIIVRDANEPVIGDDELIFDISAENAGDAVVIRAVYDGERLIDATVEDVTLTEGVYIVTAEPGTKVMLWKGLDGENMKPIAPAQTVLAE